MPSPPRRAMRSQDDAEPRIKLSALSVLSATLSRLRSMAHRRRAARGIDPISAARAVTGHPTSRRWRAGPTLVPWWWVACHFAVRRPPGCEPALQFGPQRLSK